MPTLTGEHAVSEHHNGDAHVRMIINELHGRARQLIGHDFMLRCWIDGTKVRHTRRWVAACRKAAEEAGFRWVATGRRCRDGARIVQFVGREGRVVHLKLGLAKRTPIA